MPDVDRIDDDGVLARTFWGTARHEGPPGMLGLAHLVRNRYDSGIRWWGMGLREICLKPREFACWAPDFPEREKMLRLNEADATYFCALNIATSAIFNILPPDPTDGATSYCVMTEQEPPAWTYGRQPSAIIGTIHFFKL